MSASCCKVIYWGLTTQGIISTKRCLPQEPGAYTGNKRHPHSRTPQKSGDTLRKLRRITPSLQNCIFKTSDPVCDTAMLSKIHSLYPVVITYYTEHIIYITFQLSSSAVGQKSLTQQLNKFWVIIKCFKEGKDSQVGRRTKGAGRAK